MTSYFGQTCKSCDSLQRCLEHKVVSRDEIDIRFCKFYWRDSNFKPATFNKRLRDDRKYYRTLVEEFHQDHYSRRIIFDVIKNEQPVAVADIVRSTRLTYGQVLHQVRMLLRMKVIEVVRRG